MKDDPTGWFEQIIESEVAVAVEAVNKLAPAVMNRPPLETDKPKEVQHQEWVEAMTDPNLLMQRYQMLVSLYGPEKGELLLRKWDEKHRKMVAEMPRHDVMEENHAATNAY